MEWASAARGGRRRSRRAWNSIERARWMSLWRRTRRRSRLHGRRSSGAHAMIAVPQIIFPAFGRIAEHAIGGVDALHHLRARIAGDIGMIFAGQTAICLPDRLFFDIRRYLQDGIEIGIVTVKMIDHVCSPPTVQLSPFYYRIFVLVLETASTFLYDIIRSMSSACTRVSIGAPLASC